MDIRGDDRAEALDGTSGADTVDGGGGDDTLRGGFGFDTYLYGPGGGADVIDDGAPGPDALIVSGYASAEASLSFAGPLNADLLVDFGGGDSILIRNGSASAFGVETVTFADGVTLTQSDLRARILGAARTDGPDLIVGTLGADTLEGGPGDDTLQGLSGPDAYRYGVGDGADVIDDDAGGAGDTLTLTGYAAADATVSLEGAGNADMRLDFGGGDSVLIRNGAGSFGVETTTFADGVALSAADLVARAVAGQATAGADLILGSPLSDTLDGGPGDDTLTGFAAGDDYRFAPGGGADVIDDGGAGSNDRLTVTGYGAQDFTVTLDGDAVRLDFGGGDSVTVRNAANVFGVESFVFDDATLTRDEVLTLADPIGLSFTFEAPQTGAPTAFTVTVENQSLRPITAPMVFISAADALVSFEDADGFAMETGFIAYGTDADPLTLAPGETVAVSGFYLATGPVGVAPVLTPSVIEGGESFDWDALLGVWRDATTDDGAWDAIIAAVEAQNGATAGDFAAAVFEDRVALAAFGLSVEDPTFWLRTAFDQAAEFGGIAARGLDGALGEGWPSLADMALVFADDGAISLRAPRPFAAFAAPGLDGFAHHALSNAVGLVVTLDGGIEKGVVAPYAQFRPNAFGAFVTEDPGLDRIETTADGYRVTAGDGGTADFDATGRLLSVTTPGGGTTTATHDAGGRLVSLTAENGARLDLGYDAAGALRTLTDADGRARSFAYDAEGRLTGSTTDATTAGFAHDAAGRLAAATTTAGAGLGFGYDAMGRLASVDFGGETVAQFDHRADGGYDVTDGSGATTAIGLLQNGAFGSVTNALGERTGLVFEDGALVAVERPDGSRIALAFDAQGRLTAQTQSNGATLSFDYAADVDQLTSITDPSGATRSFRYDADGALVSATWPDGTAWTFERDDAGRLVSVTDRTGAAVAIGYDAAGRPSSYSDGDAGARTLTYDGDGRLTRIEDDAGATVVAYDDRGLPTRLDFPDGRALVYGYDEAGRRTSMTDGDGVATTWAYDALGRLVEVGDGARALVAYSYDGAGRLTGEVRADGATVAYAHDAAGRLVDATLTAADGSTPAFSRYVYDGLGQRVAQTTQDGAWSYGYDAQGRLVAADFVSADPAAYPDRSFAYAYDAAGVRTTSAVDGVETVYARNALGQVVTVGADVYAYDAAGRLAEKTTSAGVWRYDWTVESRLARATAPDGRVTDYEYDAFGSLAATVEDGVRVERLVDPFGGDLLARFDASGARLDAYRWGLGLAGAETTDLGAVTVFADGVGTVLAVFDAAGALVAGGPAGPFGEPMGAGLPLAFGFNGALGVEALGTDGLLFMRDRLYDPALGRFVSEEPQWFTESLGDLMQFALNNPVSFFDATGNDPQSGTGGPGSGWYPQGPTPPEGSIFDNASETTQEGWSNVARLLYDLAFLEFLQALLIPGAGMGASEAFENLVNTLSDFIDFLSEDDTSDDFDHIDYSLDPDEVAFDEVEEPEPAEPPADPEDGEPDDGDDGAGDPAGPSAPGPNPFSPGTPEGERLRKQFQPERAPVDNDDLDDLTPAKSTGDPHLVTHDALAYDLQAVGEFTLMTAPGRGVEVQARMAPYPSLLGDADEIVSVNAAVAIGFGDHRIAIHADRADRLWIDGRAVALADGASLYVDGATVNRDGGRYTVIAPGGDGFVASLVRGNFLNIQMILANADPGAVAGLLGDGDGDRSDDFQLRDGTVLAQPIAFDTLYRVFAEDWRVTDATSLFDYAPGEGTADVTDRDYPGRPVTLADLDPAVRAAAEAIVRAAGLTPGVDFDNAVLDVALTGDPAFADQGAPNPDATPAVVDLPPVAGPDAAIVDEDGAVLVDVLADDVDPEGGALTLLSAAAPAGAGVVTVVETPEGQRLRFTPAADLNGPATLSYRVGDAAGNVATGAVAVAVTPVPDAPRVSGPVMATVAEDAAPIMLDLLATASDPDAGDALSVANPGALPAGATLAGAMLTVDPSNAAYQALAAGESAVARLDYAVADRAGALTPASAEVTIMGVNDAPDFVALPSAFAVSENTTAVATLAARDPDAGAALAFSIEGGADAALFAIDAGSGALRFRTAPDFETPGDVGGDNGHVVVVGVSDGTALTTATLSITVADAAETPPNVAPAPQDDAFAANEDAAIGAGLSLFADNGAGPDVDADGDALSVAAVNGLPAAVGAQIALASGALLTVNADGTFVYDPNGAFDALNAGETAADSFTYRVTDGTEARTATATVTVAGVDDPARLTLVEMAPSQARVIGTVCDDAILIDRSRSSQILGDDGADVFVFGRTAGDGVRDVAYLRDFAPGVDAIDLSGQGFTLRTLGRDSIITLAAPDRDTLFVTGVTLTEADLTDAWTNRDPGLM